MTRREMLSLIAQMVVVAASSMLPGCMGDDVSDESFTSDTVSGHSHNLLLTGTLLSSPPSTGYSGSTSTTQDHSHEIDLTQSQLQMISTHSVFSVDTLDELAHNHTFTFK